MTAIERIAQKFPALYGPEVLGCSFVPDGWEALVTRLSEAVLACIQAKGLHDLQVVQVKEKFGALRFYLNYVAPDEVSALIRAAEEESGRTCETCGKLGERRTIKGWVRTVCPEHAV